MAVVPVVETSTASGWYVAAIASQSLAATAAATSVHTAASMASLLLLLLLLAALALPVLLLLLAALALPVLLLALPSLLGARAVDRGWRCSATRRSIVRAALIYVCRGRRSGGCCLV